MQLYGSMKINDENNLEIAGVDSLKLIEKYGTPLLVFDESEIRNNIKECREGLNSYSGSSQILYASKAFANRTLYRILLDENINLDVVSGGELYTALSADFPTDKIFFHGNNKLPSEIKMGLDNNIAGFFIDNVQEAVLLEKMAKKRNKKLRVFLRLKPGLTAHTHEFILTGNDDSKFGVSIKSGKAMSLVRKIINEYSHLELTGIHAHIG
ncbi:MAG: diaminopimelate decarboxylase family protein, partial [Halanaerobiales bacterium]